MFGADVDLAAIQSLQPAALGGSLDVVQEQLQCREALQELGLELLACLLLFFG